MGIKTTTLLVLAALSAVSAFYTLIPANRELIYDYKALVQAGSFYPEDYGSEFHLYGKLYVTVNGPTVYFRFKDLTYKTYNGKVDYKNKAQILPITEYKNELTSVFAVTYDEYGVAKTIHINKNEHPFCINIKKGIANTFQMNYKQVMSSHKKHAFIEREPSIYGMDSTHYNVYFEKNNIVKVERYHDVQNSTHLYKYMFTNTEVSMDRCEDKYENPMSHDSIKVYSLKKHDDQYVAEHITTTGGVYIHPFKAQSEAQHLYTNATFELVAMNPVQKHYEVVDEKIHQTIRYIPYDFEKEYEGIPDLYQGRRIFDMNKLRDVVYLMLGEMVEYMDANHIHSRRPDIKKGQLINRIQRPMALMDYRTVENLWNHHSQMVSPKGRKMFEIYQQLLPMIGTRATLKLIVDIISNKKVKDNVAFNLLREMPFNTKLPTVKLLQEMEVLTKMDATKVSWNVRKSALLAFATLVHKSYKYNKEYMKDVPITFADKYVTDYITRFREAKTHDERLLYIQCLLNMEIPAIVTPLMKIVTGEWEQDEHIRLMAMWAIFPVVRNNDDLVYELYWPIMTDVTEITQHRIVAFYFIMQANPSISRMVNIYWHMVQEPNHEVYQFYYKYFQNLAQTKDPCKRQHQLYAKQGLKYLHPPNSYGMTGYYAWDYTDETYGFGKGLHSLVVYDRNSLLVKFGDYANFFNVPFYPSGMLIRVHGIDGIEEIGMNILKDSDTLIQHVVKYFKDLKTSKKIHLEVMLCHHNKIYASYFWDAQNMDTFVSEVAVLFEDFHSKSHDMRISQMYSKVFMPTDIGFIASMDWIIPEVSYRDWEIKRETIKDVITWHVEYNPKTWSHSRYGLSFYNSITDVWQGINRFRTYDSSFPLNFDVVYHKHPATVKVTFKQHGDDFKDTFGYRSHVTTMTFVKDDEQQGILERSMKDGKTFTVVTKGEEYRHNYMTTNDVLYGLKGYDHVVEIYDSERLYTNRTLKNMGHFFDITNNDFFQSKGWFATIYQKWDNIIYQPHPGTNGIMEKIVPSKEHPVTSYEVSLRSSYDIVHGDLPLLPGIQWHTKLSLTSYRQTNPLKTWDVHALYSVNPGHKMHNLKMQLHRIISEGSQFKYCVEGSKKYMQDQVTGYLSVSERVGPVEQKCTEEDKIFEVTMKGIKSEEQLEKYPVYGECDENVTTRPGFHHKFIPCYMAHDTFRNYTYDIHTNKNMKNEYKKVFIAMWDSFKGAFYENYEFFDQHEDSVKEDHTKVQIIYPLFGKTFNTYVVTPNHAYHFEDLKDEFGQWMFFHPDTIHFTNMYKVMHRMGMTNYCSLYNNSVSFKHESEAYNLPTEWSLIVGDKEVDPTHAVYAKVIDNRMALRMSVMTHSLVIIPTGEHQYDIIVDGKKTPGQYVHEEWVYLQQQPHSNFMAIIGPHLGVHMFYDGTHVHLDTPKVDVTYYGKCYPKH